MNTYICIQPQHSIRIPGIKLAISFHNIFECLILTIEPAPFGCASIVHGNPADITALVLANDNLRVIQYNIDITVQRHYITDLTLLNKLCTVFSELGYDKHRYPLFTLMLARHDLRYNGTI